MRSDKQRRYREKENREESSSPRVISGTGSHPSDRRPQLVYHFCEEEALLGHFLLHGCHSLVDALVLCDVLRDHGQARTPVDGVPCEAEGGGASAQTRILALKF